MTQFYSYTCNKLGNIFYNLLYFSEELCASVNKNKYIYINHGTNVFEQMCMVGKKEESGTESKKATNT